MPISLHVTVTDLTMFGLTGSVPQQGPICFEYDCNTSHRRHTEVNILSPPCHSQVQGPLYLDKVCPALYRWKEITDSSGPCQGCLSPGDGCDQELTRPRLRLKAGHPVPPTATPAATAPPGPGPGWDCSRRRMLLWLFLVSVDVASTEHGCGQPGSRAHAALRSRTVPGLGSAPPTRAWDGGIMLGKLPGSDHSLVGCPQ